MLRGIETAVQHGFRLAQGILDEHICQGGNLGGSFCQRRNSQHVAQHDAHILASLEAGEAFAKLFARKATVQVVAPTHKVLQQVGIADQRVAKITAVAEHHQRVVNQETVSVQQPQ